MHPEPVVLIFKSNEVIQPRDLSRVRGTLHYAKHSNCSLDQNKRGLKIFLEVDVDIACGEGSALCSLTPNLIFSKNLASLSTKEDVASNTALPSGSCYVLLWYVYLFLWLCRYKDKRSFPFPISFAMCRATSQLYIQYKSQQWKMLSFKNHLWQKIIELSCFKEYEITINLLYIYTFTVLSG